jgi:hypothetical protein
VGAAMPPIKDNYEIKSIKKLPFFGLFEPPILINLWIYLSRAG